MNSALERITSVRFANYKAFKDYSASFRDFNVLVGPNNAGKSTILGAIRILSEGIRKARTRNPERVWNIPGKLRGYAIHIRGLPVSTENVFHDYNDSEPAVVAFRVSNGNQLLLYFLEQGSCFLVTDSNRPVRSTTDFKREFPLIIAFVPVLGPVEHNERLNEAVDRTTCVILPQRITQFQKHLVSLQGWICGLQTDGALNLAWDGYRSTRAKLLRRKAATPKCSAQRNVSRVSYSGRASASKSGVRCSHSSCDPSQLRFWSLMSLTFISIRTFSAS